MSDVNISSQAANVQDGQADSFPSKPVSMVSLRIYINGVIRQKRLYLAVPELFYGLTIYG